MSTKSGGKKGGNARTKSEVASRRQSQSRSVVQTLSESGKAKSSRGAGTSNRSRRTKRTKRSADSDFWFIVCGASLFLIVAACAIYYFFIGPYSCRLRMLHSEPTYPEGYNIRGIDISHYQGEIRWDVLRNASINNDPVRFVFIKATEGVTLMDDNFNENFYQARQNDFVRGVYHFFTPDCSAERQARFFLHQVHLEPGDLPPVLDVEKKGSLSGKELRTAVKRWLDIVEKAYGVKPIIYTGYKFKTSYLNDSIFQEYPYWIAHYYVDKLRYKGEWAFWQHTDRGRVDGITGDVDVNIFNGNLQDLNALTLKEKFE